MGKLWGSWGGGVWRTLARAPGQVGLAGLGMWLWRPGLARGQGIWGPRPGHLGPWGLLSNLRLREGLDQTERVGRPEPLRWLMS